MCCHAFPSCGMLSAAGVPSRRGGTINVPWTLWTVRWLPIRTEPTASGLRRPTCRSISAWLCTTIVTSTRIAFVVSQRRWPSSSCCSTLCWLWRTFSNTTGGSRHTPWTGGRMWVYLSLLSLVSQDRPSQRVVLGVVVRSRVVLFGSSGCILRMPRELPLRHTSPKSLTGYLPHELEF